MVPPLPAEPQCPHTLRSLRNTEPQNQARSILVPRVRPPPGPQGSVTANSAPRMRVFCGRGSGFPWIPSGFDLIMLLMWGDGLNVQCPWTPPPAPRPPAQGRARLRALAAPAAAGPAHPGAEGASAIPPRGRQEAGLASQENRCPKRLPLRNRNNSGSGSREKSSSPVSAGPSRQPGRLGRWGRLGAWTVLLHGRLPPAPAPRSCPWRGASGSKYHPHPTVRPIF